jgi:hypothetical protein
MIDDDVYCTRVEQEVIMYLTRCVLDDFRVGAVDFAEAVGDALHQAFQEFCEEI